MKSAKSKYLALLFLLLIGCELFEKNDDENDLPYTTPIVYSNTTVSWGAEDEIFIIEQDLIFDSSSTLIIMPGSKIEFTENTVLNPNPAGDMLRSPKVTIMGNLIADGLEDNKITFLPIGEHQPSFWIDNKSSQNHETRLHWIDGVGFLNIKGSRPVIKNCNIDFLYISNCKSVLIFGNIIRNMSFQMTSGTVEDNHISGGIYTYNGSIHFEGNTIDSEERKVFGFRSQYDDWSFFIGNSINNRVTAIEIVTGFPTINQNNISDYDISINIALHIDNPEKDTLDLSNNWWGTTNLNNIYESIISSQSGGTDSAIHILIEPIATQPFE